MIRLFTAATVLLLSFFTIADAADAPPEIRPVKISDNFYVFYGGGGLGGNVGMSIGEDGILLVDAMRDVTAPALFEEIRKVSDKPIKYVINTHSDADHSGGNAFFADKGALIIAQLNARYSPAQSDLKVSDAFSLIFNGQTVHGAHVTAHSYDDLIIYFSGNNIVFTGDTFTNTAPSYSFSDGAQGQYAAIDAALGFADDETAIVPGHGFIDDNAGLQSYRARCAEWIARIAALKEEGKTPAEMVEDETLLAIKRAFITRPRDSELAQSYIQRPITRVLTSELVSTVPLSSEALDAITGLYAFEDGSVAEIRQDGEKIFMVKSGDYMIELLAQSETFFKIRVFIDADIRFERNDAGAIAGFTLSDTGETTRARKLPDGA